MARPAPRRRTPRFLAAFLAVPIVVIASGCGGDASAIATIVSDSAGVSIHRYEGGDRPAGLRFVEELRLGGSETRPEEGFFQVRTGQVGIDAAGRIHILDASAGRVVVFDDEGRHLRTVGSRGEGPGELSFPMGLSVTPEGEIGVMDIARRGLVRFSVEGDVLPTIPFPSGWSGGTVHRFDGRLVTQAQRAGEGGEGFTDVLLEITEGDTAQIVSLERPEMRPIQLESCGMGFSGMPPIFHPTLRWHAAGERVAVVHGAEYDVRIFEGGREVRRVRRAVDPLPADRRLALEEQGEGMRVGLGDGSTRVCDPGEVVDQRGVAPVVPAVGRVALSPDGALWIERGGVGEAPRAVDLFDAEGAYRGTFPPGSPFPVAFFPDGRIAVSEADELDVERLVVLRLEEGEP